MLSYLKLEDPERVTKKRAKTKEERKERRLATQRRYYKKHREKEIQRRIDYKNADPVRYILQKIKWHAKRKGLDFNLTPQDIIIPDVCPILLIPLKFSTSKQRACAPSVDRVDNSKGYVKGNVRVISQKANHLKSDMTKETIQRLLDYVSKT